MPAIVREARVTQSLRADNARDMVAIRDGGSLQQFVDSILMVREKPLPSGGLREDRREAAGKIFAVLTSNVFLDGKARKEYSEGISQERKSVAKSFSRLIALYASYRGNAISEISPDLQKGLLELSRHLQTETSMLVEEGIPRAYFTLPKFSAFEVIEAKHELLNRYSDDKTVMANLGTIISSAIGHSNLGMMLSLAAGTTPTKNKIEELYKKDPVVMANLSTIIYAALGRGSLNLAFKLAEGVSPTKNKIEELYKKDPVVMANLPTIISAALSKGSMNLAFELAKGAAATKNKIEEQYKKDPVVMANLSTIIYAALHKGSLNLAFELAKGAAATKNKIEEQYKSDPVVMANLSTIIYAALHKGSLNYASALAKRIHDNRSALGELRRE